MNEKAISNEFIHSGFIQIDFRAFFLEDWFVFHYLQPSSFTDICRCNFALEARTELTNDFGVGLFISIRNIDTDLANLGAKNVPNECHVRWDNNVNGSLNAVEL